MCFEKDYKNIVKYAKAQTYQYQLQLQPDDLINDAYLIVYNEYSFENIIKAIHSLAIKEKNCTPLSFGQTYRFNKGKSTHLAGDHSCRICLEVKNSQAFSIRKEPNGKTFLNTVCKSCLSKEGVKWYRKNKERVSQQRKEKRLKENADKPKKEKNDQKEMCRIRYYTKQGRVAPPRKIPHKTKTEYQKYWLNKNDNRGKWNAYMRERNKKRQMKAA